MIRTFLVYLLMVWTLGLSYGQLTPSKITSDHIMIAHRGPIDKPIFPLIITATKLQLNTYEIEVLVDKDLFSLVREFLKTDTLIASKREINEFGVFEVTRQDKGQLQSSYFPSRLKSISILKSLKEKINGRPTSEKLTLEINRVLERIEY